MIANDFLQDDDGDLSIQGGDFATGPSDTQHSSDILLAAPGTFKNEPLIGVDIVNELGAPAGAEDINRIRQLISENLALDGLEITDITDFTGLDDFELKVERP